MRFAITGGNGFLAGYLLRELEENGHEVILLTRRPGERDGRPYTVTDYSEESLSAVFSRGLDGIAHLASSRKVAEQFSFYNDLVEMTQNLYRAAAASGVKNIVYTSSISVYSGPTLPYTEEQAPKPANLYGVCKMVLEMIGNTEKDLNVKNLRLAHLYGANEQNDYMINRFFRQAHAHEQLQVYCKSEARREMLYTKDAAKAIRLALQKKDLSCTLNIGSGEFLTNEEIARTIIAVMSPELEVLLGDAPETISSSYMDSKKATEILGFVPGYSFREAVADIDREMP